jgi:predicted dehydrogenase
VRWGILGAGSIARVFAAALSHTATGVLAAVGTRDPFRPGTAEAFPGARIHGTYDALLADREVDAIYVATPHVHHREWVLAAAAAHKHILCEKPVALTARDAEEMTAAAGRAGVFFMEAYMYRTHPQVQRLIALIAENAIGEVRQIYAANGFASQQPPTHRHFAHSLAGGAILDVGGYPVSMARLIAGAASGEAFLDPAKVVGAGHIGATRVDEYATAVLEFPNSIVAQVSASIALAQERVVRIFGTEGRIDVGSPWFGGGLNGGSSTIVLMPRNGDATTITIDEPRPLYAIEIDVAGAAINAGHVEARSPAMTWADTIGNMRTLDAWRSEIGLRYDREDEVLA